MVPVPKTLSEYWMLSREEREELYKETGIGWRYFEEGYIASPGTDIQEEDVLKMEQGELFLKEIHHSEEKGAIQNA